MNPEAQAVLDAILKKDLHELTPEDKGFLKARWTYVGRRSRDKFTSIFTEKEAPKEKATEDKDVRLELDKAPVNDAPFANQSDDGEEE